MSEAAVPRVEAFTRFLLDCVKNTPNVTRVQTLQEAGVACYPYGLAIQLADSEVRWQVTWQLADGERHGHPAAEVDGEPAAWEETAVQDGGEEWLAAVIGRSRSPRVARVDRWSTRDADRPDRVGVTVFFHNGARAFVRFLGYSGGAR